MRLCDSEKVSLSKLVLNLTGHKDATDEVKEAGRDWAFRILSWGIVDAADFAQMQKDCEINLPSVFEYWYELALLREKH